MSSIRRTVFEKRYAGLLFDMDGTLLNSIAAAERVWGKWAARHGLDVEAFLPTMHGKRGIDTIRALGLPGIDVEAEALVIERGEIEDVEGVVPLPGAVDFLNALPDGRWSIVTSAPIALGTCPDRGRRTATTVKDRDCRGCGDRQA